MDELGIKTECLSAEILLSYLYGEMSSNGGERLEAHLADCGQCVDTFAEISQARYPVFEWKQVAFDPLPTPRFVLPERETATAWKARLTGLLTFRPTFAAAATVLVLAVLSVAFSSLMTGSSDVTVTRLVEPPEQEHTEEIAAVEPRATVEQPTAPEFKKNDAPTAEPASVPARHLKPRRMPRHPVATDAKRVTQPKSVDGPVLIHAEEYVDDSLRLTDIFDEIDTSSE